MRTVDRPNHIGNKISRIRELRGINQKELAEILNVSQQTISNIENSEYLKDKKLKDIAKALEVTPEAIKNLSKETIVNFFNGFYNNKNTADALFSDCGFNPLDKIVELYERLLEAERDKTVYLEILSAKQFDL